MTTNGRSPHDPSEAELHSKVLHAIQGALREEKEPKFKRIAKVVASTLAVTVLLGLPFLLSFRDQITWVWRMVFCFWVLYFLVGFSLLFKPQPRLMVSGIWSPFVIARLFLVSTTITIVQILLCPSFVFLSSPLNWNPLEPLTQSLMRVGGMGFCMGFCGFLFSFVAGAFGIGSVLTVAKSRDLRSSLIILAALLISQVPILLVQLLSEELMPFALFWVVGMALGLAAIVTAKRFFSKFQINREPLQNS